MSCVYNGSTEPNLSEEDLKQFSACLCNFRVQADELIGYLLRILKQASGSSDAKKALCTAISMQGQRYKMPKGLVDYLYDNVVM